MSKVAAETALMPADFQAERIQLVVHAAGGLLVLLTNTVLSVYKPGGATGFTRSVPRSAQTQASVPWKRYALVALLGLLTLFLIFHLREGGIQHH